MKIVLFFSVYLVVFAGCTTAPKSVAIKPAEGPCRIVEQERFIRHFVCPERTYIQRVQPVAASERSDPVLQVTCVRLGVKCDPWPSKDDAQKSPPAEDATGSEKTQ